MITDRFKNILLRKMITMKGQYYNENSNIGLITTYYLGFGSINLLSEEGYVLGAITRSEISTDNTGYGRCKINEGTGYDEFLLAIRDGKVVNPRAFVFGECSNDNNAWGDIRTWMLFDSQTGGNLLAYGSLIDDKDAQPIRIEPGTTVTIPSKAIEFGLEDMFND